MTTASEVFDLAEKLGQELRKDERLIRLADARHNFESDTEVTSLVTEYNVQNLALENVTTAGGEIDTVLVQEIQKRIDEIYKKIQESATYRELQAAQNDVNELMNNVNNTIMFQITGELPTNCTHDCSTCGGHCGG